MRESDLLNDIIRALYPWIRLNRANVGSVKTSDGRWFSTGLPKGFSDLFGTLPAAVTGLQKAVPVYIEVKIPGGKVSPEQEKFIETELSKGAIAGVCYSADDAYKLIEPYLRDGMKRREGVAEKQGTVDSGNDFEKRGADVE